MSITTTQVNEDLGLTIPDAFARESGINPNSVVWVRRMGTAIVISASRATSALDDLLSRVTDTNVHKETDFGPPQGNEAI